MDRAGDIILTRNTDEVGNDSPGFWNHAAISGGDYIIEAQREPNAVIAVEIEAFMRRYPEWCVVRNADLKKALEAANHAYDLIGMEYRKIASLFVFLRNERRGENCVSMVRKAWGRALGMDPRWRIPDHIYQDDRFGFRVIDHHKDYENWIKPDSWLEGRLA
jgi:hypothetical protein